ncbi:MAG: hypothetical protein IKW85_04515 [Muribaculaceae bacterium]|nr:hypothetical protein [Muribaculaceae bacterium]
MLAIERSERVSITTGKAIKRMSLKATPSMIMGNGVASSDDMCGLWRRGCLPLHSLYSFR